MQPEVQITTDRPVRSRRSRHERRRRRQRRRLVHGMTVGVATATLVLSAALALSVVSMHLGVRAVLTGSMRPDYGPGAVLLTERIPVTAVEPGMVVLFVPPGEHSEFAHRVTTVTGPRTDPVITTKGDANKAPDPWHVRIDAPYVSQVIGSVPDIGRIVVALHGVGQILLAVVGGILAAWAGNRWIFSQQRAPGRRAPAGSA